MYIHVWQAVLKAWKEMCNQKFTIFVMIIILRNVTLVITLKHLPHVMFQQIFVKKIINSIYKHISYVLILTIIHFKSHNAFAFHFQQRLLKLFLFYLYFRLKYCLQNNRLIMLYKEVIREHQYKEIVFKCFFHK